MNKEQALQRLSAIEKETAELKKIIEAKDAPKVFQGRYLDINNVKVDRFIIDSHGHVSQETCLSSLQTDKGLAFSTIRAIEQHVEHLRLMQEARVAMAKDWGDIRCDWEYDNCKFVICIYSNKAVKEEYVNVYHPIHFRTKEARDKFFDKYTQEELRLMIMGVE